MEITVRIELLVLMGVIIFIMSSHVLCSCSHMGMMEAFSTIKDKVDNIGGKNKNKNKKGGVYTNTQVPLPEGEMLMFANTPFKPECCPNSYSNSSGCACMTVKQLSYLNERGGNNVPYSEY